EAAPRAPGEGGGPRPQRRAQVIRSDQEQRQRDLSGRRVVVLAQGAAEIPRPPAAGVRPAGPESRNASAPGLVLRPESIAQELFLGGDDGAVLDREEQRDDAQQPEVVPDQAETEADAKVAEIERVARQRVRTVGVQRDGD